MIKNTLRNLSKKKVQTGVLFLLVFFAGAVFNYFDIPVKAIKDASTHLQTNSQTEQFRFMISSSNLDIDQLSFENEFLQRKYGFGSEAVRKKYLQQEFNNKKCNFFLRPIQKTINIPIFLKGSAPSDVGQVAVSKVFAEMNGLLVGAHIKIDGNNYIVSGIHIAPDIVIVYDTTKSMDVARDTNADIIMVENDFDKVNKAENIYFVGRYAVDDEAYIHNQISNLAKEDNILFAALSSEYQEISVLPTVVEANTSFMLFVLFLIYIVISISIFIQISIQFATYRKPIGVLMTLGVSKSQIVFSHGVYALVFGSATAAGLIVGSLMTDKTIDVFHSSYNIVVSKPTPDWPKMMLFWFLVTSILTLFVMLYSYKEALKKPLTLIYSSDNKSRVGFFNRNIMRAITPFKFESRLKTSVAIYKYGRFFLMLLAFYISCNFLGTGISIHNSTSNAYLDYKEFVNFDRVDIYDSLENNASERYEDADVFIGASIKLIKNITTSSNINTNYTMEGISVLQKSLGIDSAKLSDGIIIPLSAALEYSINIYDELQFLIDGEHFRYKVVGINGSAFDNKIYIDIQKMYKMSQYNDGDYNGAYVHNDLEAKDALYSMRGEDLIAFRAAVNQSTEGISKILLGLSIIICVPLIILVAAFNYSDVRSHVAMFNFLGYSNRQSNDMLINVFDLAGLIGCLLGYFSIPYLIIAFEKAMMVSSEYYIHLTATWTDRTATIVALMFLYMFCKFLINLVTRGRAPATVLRPE
ncbi:MAG: ABC transporter permease [Peptococcaceae bacterium]|nr:ABC transporter permease [Peptococcaceae bacterium]